MSVAQRMAQALLWVGTECTTFMDGRCWDEPHLTPDAKYRDDRWCEHCIAAYGLGYAPERVRPGARPPLPGDGRYDGQPDDMYGEGTDVHG